MEFDANSMPTSEELLGHYEVKCNSCNGDIAITENRQRCVYCDTNHCSNCEPCRIHEVIELKGFPELEDSLDQLIGKSADIFNELENQFQVPTNIYFVIASKIGPLLKMKSLGQKLEGVPKSVEKWLDKHGEAVLRRFVSLKSMGRYVDYFDRRAFFGNAANSATIAASQGTVAPIIWQGLPMMRTVWDFALIPVIFQEVKPRTVIELGTAAGGAAAYYASIQKVHGIEPNVVTMDLFPPDIVVEGVRFLRGNSNAIAETLNKEMLQKLPHPWVVIEDAHVNIEGVIEYFHPFMEKGDYLFIEDYDAEEALFSFLNSFPDQYKVDTRYTDFFGYNNTCSRDQILRKVA